MTASKMQIVRLTEYTIKKIQVSCSGLSAILRLASTKLLAGTAWLRASICILVPYLQCTPNHFSQCSATHQSA